jgi:hypothetical protein
MTGAKTKAVYHGYDADRREIVTGWRKKGGEVTRGMRDVSFEREERVWMVWMDENVDVQRDYSGRNPQALHRLLSRLGLGGLLASS